MRTPLSEPAAPGADALAANEPLMMLERGTVVNTSRGS
jgi:hypothetical protein